MRFEKYGYAVEVDIETKKFNVSNKYGDHGGGYIIRNVIDEQICEILLLDFLSNHTVSDITKNRYQKMVALNEKNEYIQLQAVKRLHSYFIQEYDNELMYIRSVYAGEIGKCDIIEKMKEMYNIQHGLMADVFKSPFDDCTNKGISSEADELYIAYDKAPLILTDIRECVTVEKLQTRYGEYVKCKPVYESNNMYAAGGNFLYTSDCRFKEITGIEYPVPIHDRKENLF